MKQRLSLRQREKQTQNLAVNVAELLAALESTNAELVVRRRRERAMVVLSGVLMVVEAILMAAVLR